MANEPVKAQQMLAEVQAMNALVSELSKTKYYSTKSPGEILAICVAAQQLGVSPFLAINGDMYSLNGKVELSARLMNRLIRQAGHSIQRDPKSDDKICILHGKRSDNGETWTESFSMEEAAKAGLSKGASWTKFPRDMLFARALSRLARQLFPDVIAGTYVQGEISEAPPIDDPVITVEVAPSPQPAVPTAGQSGAKELCGLLGLVPNMKPDIDAFLEKQKIGCYEDIPAPLYQRLVQRLVEEIEAKADAEADAAEMGVKHED